MPSAQSVLARIFDEMVGEGKPIPDWLVTSRTVLILKGEHYIEEPSEYRPITCLNTMYKAYMAALAETTSTSQTDFPWNKRL